MQQCAGKKLQNEAKKTAEWSLRKTSAMKVDDEMLAMKAASKNGIMAMKAVNNRTINPELWYHEQIW